MDDSWRFRPIVDHCQLCPVCSISHYPFCPPVPSFPGGNVRCFPSDFRPGMFHRPLHNPSPSIGPTFVRAPPHPQPFYHEEVMMDRESFRKRVRVEDPAIGVFPCFQPLNRTSSVDDERRLNLIRDHGREDVLLVEDDRHWSNNSGFQIDRDRHDVSQKHYGTGGLDNGFSESELYHRDGRYQTMDYQGYANPPILNLNREERQDFVRREFKPDGKGLFDGQIVDSFSHELNTQLDRNSHIPHFRESDEALRGSQNFASVAPEEPYLKVSCKPPSYFTNEDITSRVGNFHDQQQASISTSDHKRIGNFYDQQQTHLTRSSSLLLPNQHSHLHTDNFHMVPYHQDHAAQNHMENKSELYNHKGDVMRNCFKDWNPIPVEIQKSMDPHTYPAMEQLGPLTNHAMATPISDHRHISQSHPLIPSPPAFHGHTSQAYLPISPQPLFPIQTEPSLLSSSSSSNLQVTSSASATISVGSSVAASISSKRQLSVYSSQSLPQAELYGELPVQASNKIIIGDYTFSHQTSSNLNEKGTTFLAKPSLKEKIASIDAARLFKHPYRASRPDHIAIILRGLPGSGKSYLAKAIRDIEVENGGNAPRIHSMDDYFMIEVEKKVEDCESFKSSGSVRSKRQNTKKVIEYCYEPEMEEAYRSSMLKAFKKTLDDGIFTFVIVDDRNLRVADFAQFWAIAKRSGFEVYLLEATYKDPAGCAARNIHGFKLADIQKMAEQWENAPPLYLHLDIQSLLGGDDLIDQSIPEVDMDADDGAGDGEARHLKETDDFDSTELKSLDQESGHVSTRMGKRWNIEEEEVLPGNNELQKSKWSQDLSAELHGSNIAIENTSALSGLIQTYGKGVKFVHWGDKDETGGFSIGANKKPCAFSLIIGPGAGYNLKSNPLPEDNPIGEATGKISHDKKRRFNEQLRAERESFKAVFDRRRQRVGGLRETDDE